MLHNRPASPRARPLLKDCVSFHTVANAGDKTLLRFLSVRSKQIPEQVKTVHVLGKDPAEISAGCIGGGSVQDNLGNLRHVYLHLVINRWNLPVAGVAR